MVHFSIYYIVLSTLWSPKDYCKIEEEDYYGNYTFYLKLKQIIINNLTII